MDICDDVSAKSTTATTVLQGFVHSETRDVIQENVYVILGHGKFQRQVLHCAMFSVVVLLLHAFAYRVIGRSVDHWCRPPDHLRDMPVQEWKNAGIPVLADRSFSKCTVYDPPVPEGNEEERREVPCHRWDYDIANKADSVVSRWDLVCQNQWLYSLSSSVYTLGAVLFVPLAGVVSDRVGRRPTIMASAITMLFSCLGAGSSPSFGVFLVARMMVSATASATTLLVFIVLYEVTGNYRRALYGLLGTGVGPTVTPTVLHIMSLSRPNWKVSQAMLATATALVVAWCYCIDESPVWLLAVGNIRQAELTVLQGARYNGVDLGKARASFKAFRRQLERPDVAASAGPGDGDSPENVLRVVKFRRRAASVLLSWFAVSFAYYGTSYSALYMEEHWELTGLLLKALLFAAVYDSLTRRGQRATLSGVLLLLCASSAVKTAVVAWNVSVAVPLLKIVVEGVSAAAMCVTYIYTTEVFPTTMRSMGLCVSYTLGRMGVLLATWLSYVAYHGASLWLNLVTTIAAFASALAIQWLPEILVQGRKKQGESAPPKPSDTVEDQRKEAPKTTLEEEQRTLKCESGGRPSRSSPTKAESPPGIARAELVTRSSAIATPSSRGSPQHEASSPAAHRPRKTSAAKKSPKRRKGHSGTPSPSPRS
ncbi:solute carrier family 22 member 7-like [Dermacentor albipictus]|uniref:solute carrier family 22 member 7-like n=1 Tax=Dermacentor albipictus TaxID=60249 RepID=UPI0038FC635C